MQLITVIPAYQPGIELAELVDSLLRTRIEFIVVIDDGSEPEYGKFFERTRCLPRVHVLRHGKNLGKGAALKTGIKFVLSQFPNASGVVTADADGQHHAADVHAVAERFLANPNCIVLGSRKFGGQRVPWKNRLGNRVTRRLFRRFVGCDLVDTQTGLRAIPRAFLPALLKIQSNAFQFELEMLIASKHHGVVIVEQPIKTIYRDGNPTSHFDPFHDSIRVMYALFRFTGLFVFAGILDVAVFAVSFPWTGSILASQILGRVAACSLHYPLARKVVFLADRSHGAHLPRYLLSAVALVTVSYFLLSLLSSWAIEGIVLAKIAAEAVLVIVHFALQRDFVFSNQSGSGS